jgi:predicted unusual protein kinase regulating ubiquinone biosynthesis (AarF/ABC1/UbiB family)
MPRDPDKLSTGRVRRTASVGAAVGAAGFKGARGDHQAAAERMVRTLGQLKGGAAKIAQLASFIDTDFIPDEYRGVYQAELGKLRSDAPSMPFKDVAHVLAEEWDEPVGELFESFEQEAAAAASIGQVHRGVLKDGREVAVKIQYPGMAKALAADMSNAKLILRLARALAPGLDAKSVAEELRERVLEELDYEIEAANQRTFARAYRGHPFIVVPDVVTSLSTERVLVTEWVRGVGFDEVKKLPQEQRDRFGEIVFRFCFGSVYHLQHFNADAHPGNYLLMEDGKVAFLDFGMTKRLETHQIELEIAAIDAAVSQNPERVREALAEIGYLRHADRIDPEKLMRHVKAVGGWYMVDEELTIDADTVMTAMAAMTDPRSEFYDLVRQQSLPADELMGQRMQTGVLAVLGQLNATRNWMRIGQEWWLAAEPATELGVAEWAYFEAKGEKRVRKFALRGT